MTRSPRSLLFVAANTAVLAFAGTARANGRYPLASQLVVDPSTPSHLVTRATFGLLDSVDGGQSWRWICEHAVGYFGVEDPAIAVTADGSTLVASSRGIRVSHDGGCSWSLAAGSVDGDFGVDLTIDPAHPHEALALEGSTATGGYRARLRKTADDGNTWSPYGGPLPIDLFVETIEVAPSDPLRIYVSGRVSPSQESALERSFDSGETWSRTTIPLPAAATAFIGAVDPHDANVVYVRARSSANSIGRVLVTRDAGESWTQIWSGAGDVGGFALSADGSTIALGGPEAGVYVASTSDMSFRRVSSVGVSCLTWSGSSLLACAKEVVDGFSLGRSEDEGSTFTPMLLFSGVAPRVCPSGSSAETCGSAWAAVAVTIGADASAGPRGGASDDAGAPRTTATAPSGGCALVNRGAVRPAYAAVGAALLFGMRIIRRSKRPSRARRA